MKNMSGAKNTTVFLISIMLLILCAGFRRKSNIPAQDLPPKETLNPKAKAGDTLAINFIDSQGNLISLKSFVGKVVFINLWARWCGPCLFETPDIHAFRQALKGEENLLFVMLDMDGDVKRAQKFMQKQKYDLPVYVLASELPKDWFNGAIPTTLIIDKKGVLAVKFSGATRFNTEKMLMWMKQLINE
ncbi:TlpA family protein disulfide reductase [Sphingobacterium sp. Mn56C]|uniref:TlpA family protein disulfide reductase n=1 Tax=Sphingobacterium sp. Mn56C TaxID=3395261 RepID=UPI003BE04045